MKGQTGKNLQLSLSCHAAILQHATLELAHSPVSSVPPGQKSMDFKAFRSAHRTSWLHLCLPSAPPAAQPAVEFKAPVRPAICAHLVGERSQQA